MRKVFLFLLMVTGVAHANNVMFGSPSFITVTATSQQVLGQNGLRSYLLIQNIGTNAAYVAFGAPKTASSSFLIVNGGNYEPIMAPSNSVYLISPNGTNCVVMEGQ